MTFEEFSNYLDKVESVDSRNEMTIILAELVQKVNSSEAESLAYLLQGRVAPKFENLEFNVAEKLMVKAISLTFQKLESFVMDEFKEVGDLGVLAEKYRREINANSKSFEIDAIFDRLKNLAFYSGSGSQDKKILALRDLFLDLSSVSCRYIARIPIGKMRLGLSAKTVLDAISWAEVGDKSLRGVVEGAYYACSDLGFVLRKYKEEGVVGLKEIVPSPGVPVFAKLVERIPTTERIIEKMGPVWTQPKFDGLRCQAHKWEENGVVKVKLFSRNLENLTEMFPDVVDAVKKLPAKSLIIDSEVIAYNSETGEFLPFQKTMNRKRKYEVKNVSSKIPVFLFAFDLLFLEGENLMKNVIEDRFSLLKHLAKNNDLIKVTETILFDNSKDLNRYFDKQVSAGLEGIIVKKKNTIYEPGTRNFDWVKLKRAMQSHLSDTVDVVVMGYYKGKGRLAKFGVGALLMGVYDKEKSCYVTLAKVGTGITDDLWREISSSLSPLEVKNKPVDYEVDSLLYPDVWVKPSVVSEIRADEITRSPVHTCARDSSGIGYALRFPRMEFFERDKLAEDCTTVKEVLSLYKNQLSPK